MTTKTSDRSARYYGTCQLCGHEQKLPGDRLSLHGYSVLWSCFVGTCPGSRQLPFEVSKDLIVGAIADARKTARALRVEAEERRLSRDAGDVEMTVYAMDVRRVSDGARLDSWTFASAMGLRKNASNDDVRGAISKVGDHFEFRFSRKGVEYVTHLGLSQGFYASTKLDDVVAKLNAREADSILGAASNHEKYADWQTQRIEGWKPTPLKPVAEEDRGTKKALVHFALRGGKACIAGYSQTRFNGTFVSNWEKVTCPKCLANRDYYTKAAAKERS